MRLFVGTSGYAYREWKGKFYPRDLPQDQMLAYYADRFAAVEINNSFYRLPETSVIKAWAAQVPGSFRFVLKAPQNITHRKRLTGVGRQTAQFIRSASALKQHQGPLFFQLPPNFKKDLPRLDAFLKPIAGRARLAFEFRHPSWFDDDTFDCLKTHSCALCIADTDETPARQIVQTTDWCYLRLRRQRYTKRGLAKWVHQIQSLNARETYVFFKHEETATGPTFAARFLELAGVKPK